MKKLWVAIFIILLTGCSGLYIRPDSCTVVGVAHLGKTIMILCSDGATFKYVT